MRFYVICGITIALGIALYAGGYYRTEYKKQLGISKNQATEIQQLTDTINIQNNHIDVLQALDAKHTEKLANAQAEIDRLHADSVKHPERVYIKAICPVSKAATASGMADAATARPTDTAVGNYWLLRKRIATTEQMILGLQDYIKTECLR
jgi:prophage endopeptidase